MGMIFEEYIFGIPFDNEVPFRKYKKIEFGVKELPYFPIKAHHKVSMFPPLLQPNQGEILILLKD